MGMSHQQQVPMTVHSGDVRTRDTPVSGWVTFACVMLSINGLLDVVYGIGAINNANFYLHDAKYVISGLNTWGWILLGTGVLQIGAVVSMMGGTAWGRWVGVAIVSVNAIGQLLFIPSAPYLSVALFAIDILIVYGLVAHGGPLPARRTNA
jgi:hypothetical protein